MTSIITILQLIILCIPQNFKPQKFRLYLKTKQKKTRALFECDYFSKLMKLRMINPIERN